MTKLVVGLCLLLALGGQPGKAVAGWGPNEDAARKLAEQRRAAPPPRFDEPESAPLIVLTFPVSIEPRARLVVEAVYSKVSLAETCTYGFFGACHPMPGAVDQSLAKSSFWASYLYEELSSRLRPGAVAMRPGEIFVGAGGKLEYRLLGPEIPAPLRVDFYAFTTPGVSQANGRWQPPRTMGDELAPAVAIYKTTPAGYQAVATSRGLAAPATRNDAPSILIDLVQSAGAKPRKSPVRQIPFWNYRLNDGEWGAFITHTARDLSARGDGVRVTADEIILALPEARASFPAADQQRVYMSLIDPAAAPHPTDSLLAREFLRAEAVFEASRAARLVELSSSGPLGSAMKSQLAAERDSDDKAGRADMLGAIAIGVGGLAGGLAGGMFLTPGLVQQGMGMSQQIQSATTAQATAFSEITTERIEITAGDAHSTHAISARSTEELRQKFRELKIKIQQPHP